MFDDHNHPIVSNRRHGAPWRQIVLIGSLLAGSTQLAAADVNQDGLPDLLWRNVNTGEISGWLLDGSSVLGSESLSATCGPACIQDWKPIGTLSDTQLLWHNATTGELSSWLMDGPTVYRLEPLSWTCGPACAADWKAVGTGYFRYGLASNGVLWHNATTGQLSVWMLDGATVTETQPLVGAQCDTESGCAQQWHVVGVNRHDKPNILWHNPTTGALLYWMMGETPGLDHPGPGQPRMPYFTTVVAAQQLSWTCGTAGNCSQSWKVIGIEDVDYDGEDDVVWYNATTGEVSAWLLDGFNVRDTMTLSWGCAAASGCSSQWQPMGFVPGFPPI